MEQEEPFVLFTTPEFQRKTAESMARQKKRMDDHLHILKDIKTDLGRNKYIRETLESKVITSLPVDALLSCEERVNPLFARLSESWNQFGDGVKQVQVYFTVLPGRKIRLDQARLLPISNAEPSDRDKIVDSLNKTFSSIDGNEVLDIALGGDAEFSYDCTLIYGKTIQLKLSRR